jgi:hypothetical protein
MPAILDLLSLHICTMFSCLGPGNPQKNTEEKRLQPLDERASISILTVENKTGRGLAASGGVQTSMRSPLLGVYQYG